MFAQPKFSGGLAWGEKQGGGNMNTWKKYPYLNMVKGEVS